MTLNKLRELTCYYDLRNPTGISEGGLRADLIQENGYTNASAKSCKCDNCFYGRTELALFAINLLEENQTLKGNH